MSDKKKSPRDIADQVSEQMLNCLEDASERIMVCGSFRRGKKTVGDVEIVFVPKMGTMADGLFDTVAYDIAEAKINGMLHMGIIKQRLNKLGSATWGAKNKLAVHVETGLPIDFFATTAENWFTTVVIRTGSKETNLRLTTGAHRMNRTLHAYGNFEDRATGQVIQATSEQHVFELAGVPYLEPHLR